MSLGDLSRPKYAKDPGLRCMFVPPSGTGRHRRGERVKKQISFSDEELSYFLSRGLIEVQTVYSRKPHKVMRILVAGGRGGTTKLAVAAPVKQLRRVQSEIPPLPPLDEEWDEVHRSPFITDGGLPESSPTVTRSAASPFVDSASISASMAEVFDWAQPAEWREITLEGLGSTGWTEEGPARFEELDRSLRADLAGLAPADAQVPAPSSSGGDLAEERAAAAASPAASARSESPPPSAPPDDAGDAGASAGTLPGLVDEVERALRHRRSLRDERILPPLGSSKSAPQLFPRAPADPPPPTVDAAVEAIRSALAATRRGDPPMASLPRIARSGLPTPWKKEPDEKENYKEKLRAQRRATLDLVAVQPLRPSKQHPTSLAAAPPAPPVLPPRPAPSHRTAALDSHSGARLPPLRRPQPPAFFF